MSGLGRAVYPTPVRLRPTTDKHIGTTAFFRNRPLLDTLCRCMAGIRSDRISVLVHACSIGAEIWSLLITAALNSRLGARTIEVVATDLEPSFIESARNGLYPAEILAGMTDDERVFFTPDAGGGVSVRKELLDCVRFLPATSLEDFRSDRRYDIVMLLNVLLYMPRTCQSRILDHVARYNRHLLVTTGFHFDLIKSDMVRNGYRPIPDNAREIHDGWLDRRRERAGTDELIPGKIYHPWSLPAFEKIEDFDYKYCAIFAKAPTVTPGPSV